ITIPLQAREDQNEFAALVGKVAFEGEINATLNGEELARCDYSQARRTGYKLIPIKSSYERKASVLYGSVVYPMPVHERLDPLTMEVLDMIGGSCHVIFLAPPGSVSVTPSRESLALTEKTITTLESLMRRMEADVRR